MDKKTAETFYRRAEALGYDQESARSTLGIKDDSQLTGPIGQYLNALAQAKKHNDNGAHTTAIVPLDPDAQRALYKSDELARFGAAMRVMAPWANNPKYPVSDQEIALVVSRGAGMGLDVLNPHEVQIWKDKHGIHFKIAYTLIAQWMNQIHGGHTKPRYRILIDDEKTERGIPTQDYACECEFLMKTDVPLVAQMVQAGWTPEDARADLMTHGTGIVKATDWNSQYFAPNARDKAFKLENRAYTDAVRRKFGTPGRADIIQLRRARGEHEITINDWQIAANEPESTRADLASLNANARQQPTIDHGTFEDRVTLLHGDGAEI